MEIPDVPKPLLEALTQAAAGEPCALVGGVVRDLLLHRHHEDPWRGLPDLDIVVEGRAADLIQRLPHALECQFGFAIRHKLQAHGAYGTFEMELALPDEFGGTWLLDVASARQETYPEPGENPIVRFGSLRDDLARRDFTVNAMALELASGQLFDLHHGQADLSARQLTLLHCNSLRDDPTRLVRGARYAARLGFQFSTAAHQQSLSTINQWPWRWRNGDDPGEAPPALGTRLRMEFELLLQREPWFEALQVLHQAGGLALLDSTLQQNRLWVRRLHWAQRMGVPLLLALVAGGADPIGLAKRLMLPHKYQTTLTQMMRLQSQVLLIEKSSGCSHTSSWWTNFLETNHYTPESVALLICQGVRLWPYLLRWWGRSRFVKPPVTAKQIMQQKNLKEGPEIGVLMHKARLQQIDLIDSMKAQERLRTKK